MGTKKEKLNFLKGSVAEENPRLNNTQVESLAKKRLKEGKLTNHNYMNEAYSRYETLRNTRYGIFSTSGVKDSLLMWSHYSDSHEGFCVGFNREKLDTFFFNATVDRQFVVDGFKVKYPQSYPKLIPYRMDEQDLVMESLITKFYDWQYENEYRYIVMDRADGTIKINSEIISEVILGCRIQCKVKRKIIKLLSKRSDQIPLFQAKRKMFEFGLDFGRITY